MRVWKYDADKSSRGKLKEPITRKQVDYILSLANYSRNRRYASEIFGSISDWAHKDKPTPGNIRTLTKGQAAFIIGALRGDISPVDYAVPGISNEAQREKTLAAARQIINNKIAEYKNFPQPIDDDE